MNQFFISDLHFDNPNIMEYDNRPFKNLMDMNMSMTARWNNTISDKDEVYINGDFADCSGTRANELLHQLNGKKYLIVGNHDTFLRDPKFDRALLVWIKDYAIVDGIVLFHYPILSWYRQGQGSIHIHGHIHNYYHDTRVREFANSLNCAAPVNDYFPCTLKTLKVNKQIYEEKEYQEHGEADDDLFGV